MKGPLTCDSYVLFSIGNIRPLLQAAFPACWKNFEICNQTWTQAIDYLEIVGIIFGQILIGIVGDWLGRRVGLVNDAAVMFTGLVLLTAAWGSTQNAWVIFYVWSLFLYGIGVGGEYPMTAASGMENGVGAGKLSSREDRLHRGRKVTSGDCNSPVRTTVRQADHSYSLSHAGVGTTVSALPSSAGPLR